MQAVSMLKNRFPRPLLTLAAAIVAGSASLASASLIPAFQSTTPSGGNTTFIYDVNFGTGTPANERLQSGDFFTLYDIVGLVSAAAPAGWTLSTQAVGITPPGTVPVDTVLSNVTFTYAGSNTTTDSVFTGFGVTSSVATSGVGAYTSSDRRNGGPLDGTAIAQIGPVIVPAVPEPAAIGMVGFALLGLARRKGR